MQDNVQPHRPDDSVGYRRPDPLEAALLAAWNAGEPEETDDAPAAVDAPLMRVDAPQVTGCPALDRQCRGQDCQTGCERVHYGPERGLRVSFVDEPLLPFELAHWDGEQPQLAFFGDGSWPGLDVDQVDELLLALDEYTGALRVAREHLVKARAGHARAVDEGLAALLREDGQDAHEGGA
ncbi:hypothetical protein [Streptomyces violaceoruber]|uniref:Uncharacterized protein n=1 Tax=Streptomyces violaceoruber TaxID=1935 RepID=A0ACD4WTX1_STRVN|nr:hypothetical protein R2E43_27310 [Streptomyces violaceoruber]BDD71740.1 hypothetical protein JCM4020_23600 [Streptomyces coelicolor]